MSEMIKVCIVAFVRYKNQMSIHKNYVEQGPSTGDYLL